MQEPRPPEEHSLASVVTRAASVICSEQFPTADRAKLRRMAPGRPLPLVFIRFALSHLPANWEHQAQDWAALLGGIAMMAPTAHRTGYGLGRALAENKYSEARLERLLNADGMTRRTLFLRAVRFLAAKAAPFDWLDAAHLLLTRDEKKREHIHQHIARDFYTHLAAQSSAA